MSQVAVVPGIKPSSLYYLALVALARQDPALCSRIHRELNLQKQGIALLGARRKLLLALNRYVDGFNGRIFGGCVRDSIVGAAYNDIDVQFNSNDDLNRCLENFGVLDYYGRWNEVHLSFALKTYKKTHDDGYALHKLVIACITEGFTDVYANVDFTVTSLYKPDFDVNQLYFTRDMHVEQTTYTSGIPIKFDFDEFEMRSNIAAKVFRLVSKCKNHVYSNIEHVCISRETSFGARLLTRINKMQCHGWTFMTTKDNCVCDDPTCVIASDEEYFAVCEKRKADALERHRIAEEEKQRFIEEMQRLKKERRAALRARLRLEEEELEEQKSEMYSVPDEVMTKDMRGRTLVHNSYKHPSKCHADRGLKFASQI